MWQKIVLVLLLLGLLVPLFTMAFAKNSDRPPVTVTKLSLKDYAGQWYEVARIPNRFQDKCVSNTQANYTLNQDGSVKVINSCKEAKGKTSIAEGKAWRVDPAHPGRLKVGFFNLFGWYPGFAKGDYWVLAVKPYRYSVIGHPDRKWGWVLSRTPQLDDDSMKEAATVLKRNGYNVCQFLQDPPAGSRPRQLAFCSP